jgi:hypothetical protein
MGEIKFEGESPFVVPLARASTARKSGDGVEMTVYASAHGKPPSAFEILLRMTPDEAQQLARDLNAAAIAADREGR